MSVKETLGFQTEVKQLLHLMIHALYSNKEIFLRELISNGSDAIDKLRFAALSDNKIYENDPDLNIKISCDKEARTITISDNGIGMNREEVITNLGTIAKSGTKEFLSQLTGEQAKDSQLIGQFGVGFYSAFIVADKVSLTTRRAGLKASEAVRWESAGEGEYTLEETSKETRGTEITLHLKKGEDEFLEDFRIRNIISKYSDHISVPILMEKTEKPTDEKDKASDKNEQVENADMVEFETINKAQALWTLPKQEIKVEDYNEFYKYIAHDFEDPLLHIHNKVEGKLEYTSLLFVPGRAPFDLWNRERQHGLKLYVKRVFIMDNAEQFMPSYLRFIRGVIDSNDLPLNISREILQSNPVVDTIRSALVKRTLDSLEKLAKNDKEKYTKFWKEFGQVLKEGPGEDFANKEKIAGLLRFASTHTDENKQEVSLADYVSRMKKDQKKIYYVTAESFAMAKNSPHLEIFRKNNIEVLLLSDKVDEWLTAHLNEYDGKTLQSVAQGGLDLEEFTAEDKQEQEKQQKELESLTQRVKDVLKDKVKEVKVSSRLTSSPACLVADENDMGRQLQRLLKASGQNIPNAQPIFELNPNHLLVKKLDAEKDEIRFSAWTRLLFDQAVLSEGAQLEDPAGFVKQMNEILLEMSQS